MPDDAAQECVQGVMEAVATAMRLDVSVAVTETDGAIFGEYAGADGAELIGRRGTLLDAIQHIASRASYQATERRHPVVIEADGYRERRREQLFATADRAAIGAAKSGEPVELDAMNAYERKIVHEHLKERADVETYSEGREPSRYVVIAPLVDDSPRD
jgi:spoIIIJ-associated protein